MRGGRAGYWSGRLGARDILRGLQASFHGQPGSLSADSAISSSGDKCEILVSEIMALLKK